MYTDSVGYVSIAINYFIYHMIISLELPLILLGKMSILLGKIGESPIFSNLQFFPAGSMYSGQKRVAHSRVREVL